jgi:glucosylceramidase
MIALGVAHGASQVDKKGYELQKMNYVLISEDAAVSAQPIVSEPVAGAAADHKNGATVVVKLDDVVQSNLAGIGGAFNEQGGEAFMSLSEAERKKVAEALFNPTTGAGLTFCRTAIGSSDFGLGAYSYSETPDDYKMKDFSVERDTTSVIPFMHAAQAENSELKIFASPWSPPGWMKVSGKMDKGGPDSRLIKDPKIYKAYALYFDK